MPGDKYYNLGEWRAQKTSIVLSSLTFELDDIRRQAGRKGLTGLSPLFILYDTLY
jgi:hypothetical protein